MKKHFIVIILMIISSAGICQNKPLRYFDQNGKEIDKSSFINAEKSLSIFFENDTMTFGISLKRENYGKLNLSNFKKLKGYLSEITNRKIDTTKNIVINYLSAYPKRETNTKPKSSWYLLDSPNEYVKQLSRKANAQHFWINSPENDNLEYYHYPTIKWISDKNKLFNDFFFPYDVDYGNFILIKPNGEYFFYLGEYGKNEVWKYINQFLK